MLLNSVDLFKKSEKYIPGGVNSPVRAFRYVNRTPFFVDRAKGPYIYDVDGNRYIDYVCSWGPAILGHAFDPVIEAVKEACCRGLTFGAPTEKELVLAELIQKSMPSMEMMRLVNSGTEACMSAIRVARGYTKRDKIVKFVGCYHGHSDGLLVKAGSGLMTESIPDSSGVPSSYAKNTLLAEYNNIESVKLLFEKFGDDIACIIVEPVAANMGVVPPDIDFLKYLRAVTQQYGALLIFDEVITGFRLALGGAQEFYSIKPDLTTLGKIVGGGMPLAVYGGRKDIMNCVAPIGSVYQAGTLSGNPIAVTAGIETLKYLINNPNIYSVIDKAAGKLEKAYLDIGVKVNRVGSLLSPFFTNKQVKSYDDVMTSDRDRFIKYFDFMLSSGIYVAPSQYEAMFVSLAHDNDIIDKTVDCIMKFGESI